MTTQRRLPLNTLRAFEAVGRHSHVRRAAEELHLTHAALSRQIRILEEQLGTRLFDRVKNRMQLTAAGRRFLNTVQDALTTLEEGVLHLDPDSLAGELVIATTPTISVNWLPPIIREYALRYPEVKLRVITLEPHQPRLPDQFDLALCLGKPDDRRGKQASKIYQERYVAVCSPALFSSGKPVSQPQDLLHFTLLQERAGHWPEWFATQGIQADPEPRFIHFEYGFQTIEAARQGLGIVLADELEVAADLRRGTLVQPLKQALSMDEGIYLARDLPQLQTIRSRLFIEELLRHLEKLGARLEQPH